MSNNNNAEQAQADADARTARPPAQHAAQADTQSAEQVGQDTQQAANAAQAADQAAYQASQQAQQARQYVQATYAVLTTTQQEAQTALNAAYERVYAASSVADRAAAIDAARPALRAVQDADAGQTPAQQAARAARSAYQGAQQAARVAEQAAVQARRDAQAALELYDFERAREAERAQQEYPYPYNGRPIEEEEVPGPNQHIAHPYLLPGFAPAQNVFKTIPYTSDEIAARIAEHNSIHPNYDKFIKLPPDSEVRAGYLEGCKILHGDFGNPDSDGHMYNNKLSANLNQPSSRGRTIFLTTEFDPNECYNNINEYLKEDTNKSTYTFIKKLKALGIDAGGLSNQFSIAVGDHIKTTFMKSIITDTESQAGGAAEPSELPEAPPAAEPSAKLPAPLPAELPAAAAPCPTKKKFDLSPMNFVLPPDQSSIIDLAYVLAYYAFGVSRINNFDRAKLNLGINFSAFALIVLFDTTGIIQEIVGILKTLLTKKTIPTANSNNKKTTKVNAYFHLEIDESVAMPTYKNPERIQEFKEIDNRIERLIGKLYAVEELYYRESFTDAFGFKFEGNSELQLHDEFFSLLKKFTHTSVAETAKENSTGNRIWDDVINDLLPTFNNLNLLGTSFRTFYTPVLQVLNTSNNLPVLIDLFSLGECISQPDELSAEAIKSLINYNFVSASTEQKTIVPGAINKFLDDNDNNHDMLRGFLHLMTGDISLRPITFTVISTPRTIGNTNIENEPFDIHACFGKANIYNNKYFKDDKIKITEITDPDLKLIAIVKYITNLTNPTSATINFAKQFNSSGGARLRRTRNNTTRYKKHHKHTTLCNKQRNKQRKSKKQQYKSIRRVSTRNNKKSMRSKRR